MQLIDVNGDAVIQIGVQEKTVLNPEIHKWDYAYNYLKSLPDEAVKYIEPDDKLPLAAYSKALINKSVTGYLNTWPKPPEIPNRFVWHLQDDYSQLSSAKQELLSKVKKPSVKIAIIDTGYVKDSILLPNNILNPKSFIQGEVNNQAEDNLVGSWNETQGHGTATMALLAGGALSLENFNGEFGGAPWATIVPIRVSDTVALIRNSSFVKAVQYAIDQDCEVISMSMAGVPTRAWAKIVNLAYNNGVVIVSAAGNSWRSSIKKILPKRVLYPARWDRVIAACGVCANNKPYVFKAQLGIKDAGGEDMQGNYGPKKVMRNALAAYTPNVPWFFSNKPPFYSLDGGGTSSATPQIAAAAATYIAYNRMFFDNLGNNWKKAEIVKQALYCSADTSYQDSSKYYGKGELKALESLKIKPESLLDKISKAKKAKVTLNGIVDLLFIFLRIKNVNSPLSSKELILNEMLQTELTELIHLNQELHFLLDYDDDAVFTETDKQKLLKFILSSNKPSKALKERLTLTIK